MAVSKRAVEVMIEEKMVENSLAMGDYLLSKTRSLDSPLIKEVRGRGLFQGIEIKRDLNVDANDLANLMFKRGMVTKSAQKYTLRLTPALVINKEELDEGFEIIKESLAELETVNDQRKNNK